MAGGMMGSETVRQAAVISLLFWVAAVVIAAAITAFGSESFGDYLTFVALVLLGIALLVSAPLANRLTAIEARVWTGGSYTEEARSEAGGVTPIGLLLILAPQIAIVSLLVG